MSAESIGGGPRSTDEIRYQISSANGVIQLDLSMDNQDLAVSTDPQSALLLASDILAAVNHTSSSESADLARE